MLVPQHQQRRDEGGFTFIEMILVLAVFSMLTILTFSMMFRFYEQQTYEQALERFRVTLLEAQQLAKKDMQEISVYVLTDGTIKVNDGFLRSLNSWQLPDKMQIMISTNNRILFRGNGNISQIGTITVQTPDGYKQYSINLSKGRLREIK